MGERHEDRDLHDEQLEADLLQVERLRAVDVCGGYDNQLKLPVHARPPFEIGLVGNDGVRRAN